LTRKVLLDSLAAKIAANIGLDDIDADLADDIEALVIQYDNDLADHVRESFASAGLTAARQVADEIRRAG